MVYYKCNVFIYLKENWKKWDKWKETNDRIEMSGIRCAYVKSQHYPIGEEYQWKSKDKKIFECINTWGVLDVCPNILCDSPAIKKIYEVSIAGYKPIT